MSRVRSFAITLIAMLMFSITVFSQSGLSTIIGEVKDPTGASVPNVTVAVEQECSLHLETI